jgi:hypothetical protein
VGYLTTALASGVPLNAKTAKMLRRIALAGMAEGTPEHKLLAKPVRLAKGGEAFIAVNARDSERGAIQRLKVAYERHPEVRAQIQQLDSYRQMLKAQVASGGPLFDNQKGEDHEQDRTTEG